MIYYDTDYLMHHGVKGMKWGRRKQKVLKGRRAEQARLTKAGLNIGKVSNAYVRTRVSRSAAKGGGVAGMAAGVAAAGIAASVLSKHGKLSIGAVAGLAAVPIGTAIAGRIIAGNATYKAVKKRQSKY